MAFGSKAFSIARILVTLLTFDVVPIMAQAVSGDFTGAVLDATGAAIPNATVTAQNEATGAKTQVPANNDGVYHLTNLPVGTYTLSVSATGFATATVQQPQSRAEQHPDPELDPDGRQHRHHRRGD